MAPKKNTNLTAISNSQNPIQINTSDINPAQRLKQLLQQFEKPPKAKTKQPKKPKPLLFKARRPVTADDVKRIIWLRFNSLTDFSNKHLSYPQIAKRLHIPLSTCFTALKTYIQRGNKYVNRRIFNAPPKYLTKITPQIASYLLNNQTLQRWSGWTLQQRLIQIKKDFDLQFSKAGLRHFYIKNGIKFGVCSYTYQQSMTLKKEQERWSFALKIANVLRKEKSNVVYTDESSFNCWMHSKKTWQCKTAPVKMVLNKSRGKSITIFGAIGKHMRSPLFMQAQSTNQSDFVEFLRQLRGSFIEEYSTAKITLVLDNHRAHHTKNTQQFCEQHNIELLFQPPYSPEFNSIEYLWSVVKRRFKKMLIAENEVHIQQQLFSQILQNTLDSVTAQEAIDAAASNRGFLYRILNSMRTMNLSDDNLQTIQELDIEDEISIESVEPTDPPKDSLSQASFVSSIARFSQQPVASVQSQPEDNEWSAFQNGYEKWLEQPAEQGIPLNVLQQNIRSMKDMKECLIRNGFYLPSDNCALMNVAYMRSIFQNQLWCPHADQIRFKTCFKPPPLAVMCTRINELLAARNLQSGIDLQKKNWPNVEWAKIALMELEPDNNMFAKDYVPRSRIAEDQQLIGPREGMMDGLDHILGQGRRSKHIMTSTILTTDQQLQLKIQKKQKQIARTAAQANLLQQQLAAIQNRQPNVNSLNERESARLRDLEAQIHANLQAQANEWKLNEEAKMESEIQERVAAELQRQLQQQQQFAGQIIIEQPSAFSTIDPLRIENVSMMSATANETSHNHLAHYSARTRKGARNNGLE